MKTRHAGVGVEMLRLELVEVNRSLVRKNAGRSVKFRSVDEKARVRNEVIYDDCEVSKNKPLTELSSTE